MEETLVILQLPLLQLSLFLSLSQEGAYLCDIYKFSLRSHLISRTRLNVLEYKMHCCFLGKWYLISFFVCDPGTLNTEQVIDTNVMGTPGSTGEGHLFHSLSVFMLYSLAVYKG